MSKTNLAASLAAAAACLLAHGGCVRSIAVTERGGELKYVLEKRPPVTLAFGKNSGCRVAFLPLVGPDFSIAAVAYANFSVENALLVQSVPAPCLLVSPTQAQERLAKAGLIGAYAQMQRDFDRTGLLDETIVRKAADALGVDVIVEGRLAELVANLQADTFDSAAIAFLAYDRVAGRLIWSSLTGARSQKIDTLFERKYVETVFGVTGMASEERGYQSIQPNRLGLGDGLAGVIQDAVAHVVKAVDAKKRPAAKEPALVPLPPGQPPTPAAIKQPAKQPDAPAQAGAQPSGPPIADCPKLCESADALAPGVLGARVCQIRCEQTGKHGLAFRQCLTRAKAQEDILSCK